MSSDTQHTIKLGDTLPAITATLTGGTGAAQDLTGATVAIAFRAVGGATVVHQGVASVVGALTGQVSYTFPVGVTATMGIGLFNFEWQVTLAGGGIGTFPSAGYNTLRVVSDIVPNP